jgi:hypothetical protein
MFSPSEVEIQFANICHMLYESKLQAFGKSVFRKIFRLQRLNEISLNYYLRRDIVICTGRRLFPLTNSLTLWL